MYKGLIIPLLPEKKLLGNLDASFVEKRKEELESFLRVIATHPRLKYDHQLRAFLTLSDFDNYRVNPSTMEKVMGYVEYLPSVKNISLTSLTDAV
jgi:PX domain